MIKKLIKLLRYSSILTALCGVFGLSLFLSNHKKAVNVNAVSYNLVGATTRQTNNFPVYVADTTTFTDYASVNIDWSFNFYQFNEGSGDRYFIDITIAIRNSYQYVNGASSPLGAHFTPDSTVTIRTSPYYSYMPSRIESYGYYFDIGSNGDGILKFELHVFDNNHSYDIVYDELDIVCLNTPLRHYFVESVDLPLFSDIDTSNLTLNDYDLGYQDGYYSGYQNGYDDGYYSGNSTGFSQGYSQGYDDGVTSQEQAIIGAYNDGYSAGYNEGSNQDQTVATIFSGILQIALIPVNFFLAIFNFEILGINLSSFIKAIFTIALTIIIIRTIFGGKGASD